MRRREFIAAIGVAATWPSVARAQPQPAKPVVGLLLHGVPARIAHFVSAFRQGLNETGYVEGRNLTIEIRYAEGRPERLPLLADDLVRLGVTVIAAGPIAEQAAKNATTTIPIVFVTAQDPVKRGLVASIKRPGGNLTGATLISADLEGKRIGLLRTLVPKARTVAALVSQTDSAATLAVLAKEAKSIESATGISIKLVSAAGEHDFDAAFAEIAQTDAMAVAGSLVFMNRRDRLVALAAQHKVPAVYFAREFVEAGGLMSYSASAIEGWQQAGRYTGRILSGDKPSDLPIFQPTKFELVINVKTAKAMGLELPSTLLALADEVIE